MKSRILREDDKIVIFLLVSITMRDFYNFNVYCFRGAFKIAKCRTKTNTPNSENELFVRKIRPFAVLEALFNLKKLQLLQDVSLF